MKNRKRHLALLVVCCLCTLLKAQYKVSLHITDSLNQPIEAANVALIDTEKGFSIAQGISNRTGHITLEGRGKLRVYVGYVGYHPYTSEVFHLEKDTIFPDIRLRIEDFMLEEVTVVGEKTTPSVTIERGKLIFSPRHSSIHAGGTALDLLKSTPGVFINHENNISMGGKAGASVLINGKPTYMQAEELANYLRAMPSDRITAIEVINNPSAQYDAAGSAGIINIRTDRRQDMGFYLNTTNGVSYWKHFRQNSDWTLGLANERWQLSAGYRHTLGNTGIWYGSERIQTGKRYHSPTNDVDKRKSIGGHLDATYRIDKRQLVGTRVEVNTLGGPGYMQTATQIYDVATHTHEQSLLAESFYEQQKANRYGFNFYYTYTPQETTSYTIDANYVRFDGGARCFNPNTYRDASGQTTDSKLYLTDNKRDVHIYALAFDANHPLLGGTLLSGMRYSKVTTDNDYAFAESLSGMVKIDDVRSNRFLYNEQICAGYLQYRRSWNKQWTMELGLRGEYTRSRGQLLTIGGRADEKNKRHYLHLFPSVALHYTAKSGAVWALSYGSRIDRPAYQDLNPFEYLIDELSFWKGNPFLAPQTAHKTALSFSAGQSSATLSYQYIDDYKAQITDALTANKLVMIPRNIGKQQQFSLTAYQGLRCSNIWESGLNLQLYWLQNDIAFDEIQRFSLQRWAGIFSIQNNIRLPWGIRMEVNASLSTRRLGESNEWMRSSGFVDCGFTKNFPEKGWTIQLSMTDLFHTNRWDNYRWSPRLAMTSWGKSESRQIKLNITYRFGKQKHTSQDKHPNEIERL